MKCMESQPHGIMRWPFLYILGRQHDHDYRSLIPFSRRMAPYLSHKEHRVLPGCPGFEPWVWHFFPLVWVTFPCVCRLSIRSQCSWLGLKKIPFSRLDVCASVSNMIVLGIASCNPESFLYDPRKPRRRGKKSYCDWTPASHPLGHSGWHFISSRGWWNAIQCANKLNSPHDLSESPIEDGEGVWFSSIGALIALNVMDDCRDISMALGFGLQMYSKWITLNLRLSELKTLHGVQ